MSSSENWSIEQYREHLKNKPAPKKPSKYKNVKDERSKVDGHQFDSIKEADHYIRLKAMLGNREIKEIKRQVRYDLIVNGLLIAFYKADFVVTHWTGEKEVQDVKSIVTRNLATYQMKKKLMKAIHGIDIVEII